jgi:hypothetical protein
LLQPGTALGRLHTIPQSLQLFGSFAVSISHPLEAVLSQSPNPVLHDRMTQLLSVQPDLAWASLHTLPQPPQLLWSVDVSTQIPASLEAAAHVLGSPGGHVQTPPAHVEPLAQA